LRLCEPTPPFLIIVPTTLCQFLLRKTVALILGFRKL
jgi:hypothetical protein